MFYRLATFRLTWPFLFALSQESEETDSQINGFVHVMASPRPGAQSTDRSATPRRPRLERTVSQSFGKHRAVSPINLDDLFEIKECHSTSSVDRSSRSPGWIGAPGSPPGSPSPMRHSRAGSSGAASPVSGPSALAITTNAEGSPFAARSPEAARGGGSFVGRLSNLSPARAFASRLSNLSPVRTAAAAGDAGEGRVRFEDDADATAEDEEEEDDDDGEVVEMQLVVNNPSADLLSGRRKLVCRVSALSGHQSAPQARTWPRLLLMVSGLMLLSGGVAFSPGAGGGFGGGRGFFPRPKMGGGEREAAPLGGDGGDGIQWSKLGGDGGAGNPWAKWADGPQPILQSAAAMMKATTAMKEIASDHMARGDALRRRAPAAARLARMKGATAVAKVAPAVAPARAAVMDGMTETLTGAVPGMVLDALGVPSEGSLKDEVYFLNYVMGTSLFNAASEKTREESSAAPVSAKDIRARGASLTNGKMAAIAAQARSAADVADASGAADAGASAAPGAFEDPGAALANVLASQMGCGCDTAGDVAPLQAEQMNSSVLRRLMCPQLGRLLMRGVAASAVHNVIAKVPAAAAEVLHSTTAAAHAGSVVLSTLLHVAPV